MKIVAIKAFEWGTVWSSISKGQESQKRPILLGRIGKLNVCISNAPWDKTLYNTLSENF